MYLVKSIQANPENSLSYFLLAWMYQNNCRNYNESQKWYLKCLEIDDKHEGLNSSYGYLLYLMGRYEQALKYVNIEMKLYPKTDVIWPYIYAALLHKTFGSDETAEIMAWRAIILFKREDYRQNLSYLKKVIDNDTLNRDFLMIIKNRMTTKLKLSNSAECAII